MRYLILGGGIAGTTLAEELRKNNNEASIVILEREMHRLYSKVLLMNYVKGKIDREKLFLKKKSWYQENNIELIAGVEAQKIDIKNKFIFASDGREYSYDKLIIASGMQPRLLSDNVRGISYFRNLDDAEELKELIAKTKASGVENQNAVVLGGGFIATELIDIFSHFSISTSVVIRSTGFWSKILSPKSQLILKNHVEKSGIKFYTESKIQIDDSKQDLESVTLLNRKIVPASILGIGIGLEAELRLFDDTGIKCKRGVLVNEFLETNIKDVYAIGDVAEYNDIVLEREIVSGNWLGALMHARVLSRTLNNEKTAFKLVTSYSTNLLGKEIVFIGDVSREHSDKVEVLLIDNDNSIELFERGGRTVGAVLIGDVSDRQKITDSINAKKLFVKK